MKSIDLTNQTIWLTGASRGIGRAIAEKLIPTNANLVFSASSKDSFKDMVSAFTDLSNIYFFPFDLGLYKEIKNTYERISSIFGKVDILINNAGIGIFKLMTEMTPEDFDKVLSVNFKGSYFCIQSVLPEMIKQQSGMIINISSIAAIDYFVSGTVYGASKAALTSMTNSLREEVRNHGIKVIDILPGATETEIWDKESLENFSNRMMKPEDIADVVLSAIILNSNPRLMTESIIVKPQLGNL